jgi:hypothetical protein
MPPPVIITLEQYLNLITSEHQPWPRYMSTVGLSVQPGVDNANAALSLIGLFDLDTAVGQQLDFCGQWIGQSRYLSLPVDPWFSWDTTNLGWGQGVWFEPYATPGESIGLDDYHYRILLYAKVAANFWDGTIPGAYAAWNTLFAGTGYQILIQDQMAMTAGGGTVHANMHVIQALVGPELDPMTEALFLGGYLGLKSAGVSVSYMVQSESGVPLFAWDSGPAAGPVTYPPTPLAGWDLGAWGVSPLTPLPPAYVPPPVASGALAMLQAPHALAATSAVPAVGRLAVTETGDTLALYHGTLNLSQAAHTVAAAGVLSIAGALGIAQAAQALAAAGWATALGTANRIQMANTLAAAGTVADTPFVLGESPLGGPDVLAPD